MDRTKMQGMAVEFKFKEKETHMTTRIRWFSHVVEDDKKT
jgi:hypothetical protein